MKRIRFYIGKWWLNLGLYIMPSDAKAYFGYNTNFLHQFKNPDNSSWRTIR